MNIDYQKFSEADLNKLQQALEKLKRDQKRSIFFFAFFILIALFYIYSQPQKIIRNELIILFLVVFIACYLFVAFKMDIDKKREFIEKDLAEKNKVHFKLKIRNKSIFSDKVYFEKVDVVSKFFAYEYVGGLSVDRINAIKIGNLFDVEVARHSKIILSQPFGKFAHFSNDTVD